MLRPMYPCLLTFMGNSDYSAPTRQGLGEEKIIVSQKGYYFPFGYLVPTSYVVLIQMVAPQYKSYIGTVKWDLFQWKEYLDTQSE